MKRLSTVLSTVHMYIYTCLLLENRKLKNNYRAHAHAHAHAIFISTTTKPLPDLAANTRADWSTANPKIIDVRYELQWFLVPADYW
jgi:hypothetical protein